jgi:HSP20 family protein
MNMTSLMPWTRRAPSTWNGDRDPFAQLHEEMNRLFQNASREFGMDVGPFAGGWPKVDVTDGEDAVRVEAEMPGLTEKDVEVTLKDGVLTLSGERKVETDDKERRVSERFVGRFVRQIPIGYEIDEDRVEASFAKGELTVTLPKTAQAKTDAKKIEIKSAA